MNEPSLPPGPPRGAEAPETAAGPESDPGDRTRVARWEATMAALDAQQAAERDSTWRARLAGRFLHHPLLHYLAINFWWTLLVAALAFVQLGVFIALIKLWRVTPAEFQPVVRVSIVDLIQARSLAQTATRLAAGGKPREALTAWYNASVNNPGDPDLARATLRQLLEVENLPANQMGRALSQAAWLLRLSRNRPDDLELVGRVYARFDLWRELIGLFGDTPGAPLERELRLRALFHTGRLAEFERLWKQEAPRLAANPDLTLYEAAFLAGWGTPDQRSEGWRRLETAAAQPRTRALAGRLRLILLAHASDLAGYEATLAQLVEVGADRITDHIRHWHLLAETGRASEARALAERALVQPPPPWEALDLAKAYLDLGMRETASRLMAFTTSEHGDTPGRWSLGLWVLHGDLLVELRQYDEVLLAVARIRALTHGRSELAGYVNYLEARAHQGLGRFDLARQAFEQAAALPFPFPEVGLEAGVTMLRLGYAGLAQQTLEPLERPLAKDPRYWQALCESVHLQRKDPVLLFRAAQGAYLLQPDNPVFLNNYAGALLVNRWQPGETCALTRRLLDHHPNLVSARLNHSLALALNRRIAEAEAVLAPLGPTVSELGPADRTTYHLAALQIALHFERWAEARHHLEAIDRTHLFPNQRDWLDSLESSLPPR